MLYSLYCIESLAKILFFFVLLDIAVARIFDRRGANYKSHTMTSSKIFETGTFCRTDTVYRRMEDQKPWPGLARNQDFSKRRGLKPKVKKRKCLNWKTC